MKLSEQLKERLKLLFINKMAIDSGSPTSYLSGYRQAIRDVETAEGQADINRYLTPLNEIEMSIRTHNVLKRAGFTTLGDVMKATEDQVRSMTHGIAKTWREVAELQKCFKFPVSPRLNPEGDGYTCDTCDRMKDELRELRKK